MKRVSISVRPSLYVAVPAYGGQITTECTTSLLALQQTSPFVFKAIDTPDITLARNILVSLFLKSGCQHLLFVDADMGFKPKAIAKLRAAQKPLVGCAYPKRGINGGYTFYPTDRNPSVTEGLCRVTGIGMGLALIARQVFTDLLATGKLTTYPQLPSMTETVYGFFDRYGPTYTPEDLSFCSRWRELCGGEVWALISEEISHVGRHDFRGRAIDGLKTAT